MATPKVKATPKKKNVTYEDIRNYDIPYEFVPRSGTFNNFPGCCGIHVLVGLQDIPAKAQAKKLIGAFKADRGESSGVAMVLISDAIGSKAWSATKKVAKQSKIIVNPNSQNKIAFWAITKEDCKAIFESKE